MLIEWAHRLMKYRSARWQLRHGLSPQFTGARARAWLITRAEYVRDQALGHEALHPDHDPEPDQDWINQDLGWLIA